MISLAYIALGSNLNRPLEQVNMALAEVGRLARSRLLSRSSLYRTAPVGHADQPQFVNAVALLETTLAPRELLDELLAIERRHGRVRSFANAPRPLDLDLLLYDDLTVDEPGLSIPHPRMCERAFVLVPLAEIAPAAGIPGRGTVIEWLRAVDSTGVHAVEPRIAAHDSAAQR